jgi:multisubunit Na+/H+ antiporter MnhF subunit
MRNVMAEPLHPAASDYLPAFITAPGQTDILMVVTAIILAVSVLGFGILFLRLHSLPERMAHRSHKLQFEIVAVLGLLALLTHIHAFWVAALLLALIDFPDLGGWLGRIAGAVERIAGLRRSDGSAQALGDETAADAKPAETAASGASRATPDEAAVDAKQSEAGPSAPQGIRSRSLRQKKPTPA